MQTILDLNRFIKDSQQNVFIEAEGKPNVINKFIKDYNAKYSPMININTDGIIKLQPDANKWGLELRLYLHDKSGIPSTLKVTRNMQYRGDYIYRINDVAVIKKLFDLGYRIGLNR